MKRRVVVFAPSVRRGYSNKVFWTNLSVALTFQLPPKTGEAQNTTVFLRIETPAHLDLEPKSYYDPTLKK
jgi:hypothetical protein